MRHSPLDGGSGRTTEPDAGIRVTALDTVPDLAELHRSDPSDYPYLLKSVSSADAQTGCDVLFCRPTGILRLDWQRDAFVLSASGSAPSPDGVNFLAALNNWFADEAHQGPAHALPFVGGWFLYLGYELAAQIEPVLKLPMSNSEPIAVACRVVEAIVVVHDAQGRTAFHVREVGAEGPVVFDAINATKSSIPAQREPVQVVMTESPPDAFTDAVQAALDAIGEGQVYQANLSRSWSGRMQGGASLDLFDRLCAVNPAPFAGLADFGDFKVISSSPERLVQVSQRRVSARPIAGTRPRGRTAAEDQALVSELLGTPKEQAEHVMLIDLARNDLGRVCQAGSVHVDEYMSIESYAHVHHIVSNVTGELLDTAGPGEVIASVFPGGTITGCPKVRCMQLIADLEGEPRGAYTGSIGYLNLNGDMDLNILIRTFSWRAGQLSCRAGAGIVADSRPIRELDETRHKARGLLRAVGGES
ncbi:MAG: aminodeoxychorismate synthase component I [Pseudomonadota bacterium]